jgi:hypothetical protein
VYLCSVFVQCACAVYWRSVPLQCAGAVCLCCVPVQRLCAVPLCKGALHMRVLVGGAQLPDALWRDTSLQTHR